MKTKWDKDVDIVVVGSGAGVTLMPAMTFGFIAAQHLTDNTPQTS